MQRGTGPSCSQASTLPQNQETTHPPCSQATLPHLLCFPPGSICHSSSYPRAGVGMWGDTGQVVPASLVTATRESHLPISLAGKSVSLPLLEGTRKEFLTQVYRTDTSQSTTLKPCHQVWTLSSTHIQQSMFFTYQNSHIELVLLPHTSSALALQKLGMPTHKSWKMAKFPP